MQTATIEKILWTTADLELLPDDHNHYEIIAGELKMIRPPIGNIKILLVLYIWFYNLGQ